MKDLLRREVKVGQYICYALTIGRSANLAVYRVTEIVGNKIKAIKLKSSYGCYSPAEKPVTLSMPERIFILDNFTPSLLEEQK